MVSRPPGRRRPDVAAGVFANAEVAPTKAGRRYPKAMKPSPPLPWRRVWAECRATVLQTLIRQFMNTQIIVEAAMTPLLSKPCFAKNSQSRRRMPAPMRRGFPRLPGCAERRPTVSRQSIRPCAVTGGMVSPGFSRGGRRRSSSVRSARRTGCGRRAWRGAAGPAVAARRRSALVRPPRHAERARDGGWTACWPDRRHSDQGRQGPPRAAKRGERGRQPGEEPRRRP